MGVILRGTGCCLPSRVVTSEDIAGTFDVEAEWILSRTGIRERRYAGPLDTSATLGAELSVNVAIKTATRAKALEALGLKPAAQAKPHTMEGLVAAIEKASARPRRAK